MDLRCHGGGEEEQASSDATRVCGERVLQWTALRLTRDGSRRLSSAAASVGSAAIRVATPRRLQERNRMRIGIRIGIGIGIGIRIRIRIRMHSQTRSLRLLGCRDVRL